MKESTIESFDVTKNAMEGIEEALYWHTVGVVTDRGNGIGTAVAVRWNHHCIFLTADHVIRSTPVKDLRFFFRPSGTLVRADSKPATKPIRLEPCQPIEIFDCFQNKAADIAALIVSPILEKQFNVRFHDLQDRPKLPTPIPSSVAAIGFPGDSREDLTPNMAALMAAPLWGNIERGEGWRPDDFKPRSQLLLKFLPADQGRHPGGFSGAGIWYREATPKPQVWSPNLGLAGICTDYYPRKEMLSILRVEKLAAFLSKIAPGSRA